MYHKLLRISALTLAFVLLFVSGILSPITRELSSETGSYLATAIGVQASVPQNDVNGLTAQLAQRDKELTQREIAVNLKEQKASNSDMPIFILSILLFVLLVLIVANYLLDYIRMRKVMPRTSSHEQTA